MTTDNLGHVAAVVELLEANLNSLIRQRSEIDQSIGRHQQALAILRDRALSQIASDIREEFGFTDAQ